MLDHCSNIHAHQYLHLTPQLLGTSAAHQLELLLNLSLFQNLAFAFDSAGPEAIEGSCLHIHAGLGRYVVSAATIFRSTL